MNTENQHDTAAEAHNEFDNDLSTRDLCDYVRQHPVQGLAGADLTHCKMPAEFKFPGIEHAQEMVQSCKTNFFVLMAAYAFCWLSIANVSDGSLLANAGKSNLPLLESEISVAGFFLVAPFLLLLVYIYFLVYLQRLWEELSLLPAVFPDGRSVMRHIPPWLPTGILRYFVPRLQDRRPPFIRLQTAAAAIAIWLFPPVTLGVFVARYLVTRDPLGIAWLLAISLTISVLAVASFMLTRCTLRGDYRLITLNYRPWIKTGAQQRPIFLRATGYVLAVALPLLFMTWDYVAKEDTGVVRRISDLPILGPTLHAMGFRFSADVYNINVASQYTDYSGRNLVNLRIVDSNFSNTDLSNTNLKGARLIRSQFDNTRFHNADLNGISAAGSSFVNANFGCTASATDPQGGICKPLSGNFAATCMDGSLWLGAGNPEGPDRHQRWLTETVFYDSSLNRSTFLGGSLNTVFFTNSNLRGAYLRELSVSQVYFSNVAAAGAVFENINALPDRDLRAYRDLTFVRSTLRDTAFRHIRGYIRIEDSDLSDAVFQDVDHLVIRNSDLRGTSFRNITGRVQLLDVCIDAEPTLPAAQLRLTRKSCAAVSADLAKNRINDAGQDSACTAGTTGLSITEPPDANIAYDHRHCMKCHSYTTDLAGKSDAQKKPFPAVGPPLQGVTGHDSGQSGGDIHSDMAKLMKIRWNKQTLSLYLSNPQHIIPGNRMHILGASDPVNRAYLVDWLMRGAKSDWCSFSEWLDLEKTCPAASNDRT